MGLWAPDREGITAFRALHGTSRTKGSIYCRRYLILQKPVYFPALRDRSGSPVKYSPASRVSLRGARSRPGRRQGASPLTHYHSPLDRREDAPKHPPSRGPVSWCTEAVKGLSRHILISGPKYGPFRYSTLPLTANLHAAKSHGKKMNLCNVDKAHPGHGSGSGPQHLPQVYKLTKSNSGRGCATRRTSRSGPGAPSWPIYLCATSLIACWEQKYCPHPERYYHAGQGSPEL